MDDITPSELPNPRHLRNALSEDLIGNLAVAALSSLDALALYRCVRDEAGTIVDFQLEFINDVGAAMMPVPLADLRTHGFRASLPPARKNMFKVYREVVETGIDYVEHEANYTIDDDRGFPITKVFNLRATAINDGFALTWQDVTDSVEARHRLVTVNRSLRLHERIVSGAAEGIWVVNESNITTYANAAMARMLGVHITDMIGCKITDFMDTVRADGASAGLTKILLEGGRSFDFPLMRRNGSTVWTRMTLSPLESAGEYVGGFALVTDITEQVNSRRQREIAESMYEQATEHAPIGQAIVALDGTFETVNAALCAITGYTRDELIGMRFQEITHPDDLDLDLDQAVELAAGNIQTYTLEKRYIRADGRVIWVQLHGSLIRDDSGMPVHFVAQVIDIDKERKAEEAAAGAIARLAYRSTHDSLTGLPNRSKFFSVLNQATQDTDDDSISVLFIDVDHFKRVNDGISHACGDTVLVEVARRIRACVRDSDVVGRLGGDEFAVVAAPIYTTQEAMQLADRVRDAVAASAIDTGTNQVHVTVSVGVARSTPTMSAQELLSQADGALHLAKIRGRNCAQLADSQMIESSLARLKLIHQLHEGLARDEFAPWFQPIVDLATGMTIGFEVLARWEQPELVADAGGFIDAAEDSGLIIPIGNRVINTAIEIYANEDCSETLSINASPVQLRDPDFATKVLTKLAEGRIPTSKLILEITEQSLLVNEAPIINNLQTLHANHVDLYVDDFGTGYSSLTTLRDYPISGIKLDKSFSQRLVSAPYGSIANLIRGLSELANNLRLDRIAEGIESQECAQRVHELGWQRGQGYYFGHARPSTSPDRPHSRVRRPRGRGGLEVVEPWSGPTVVPAQQSKDRELTNRPGAGRRASDRPA